MFYHEVDCFAGCSGEADGVQFAFFCVPGGVCGKFCFGCFWQVSGFEGVEVDADLFGYCLPGEVALGFAESGFDEAVRYPEGASVYAVFYDFVGYHLCRYAAEVLES